MLSYPGKIGPARGYSLVELMISVVLGLILIGSVIGLVVANLRNNAVTIKSVRLTQESRALVEIITRELRRARYNGQAMAQIGSGTILATFNTLALASSSCLKYAYDADDDGVADAGEFRMFSRATVSGRGVVRYGRFNTGADLTAASCTTDGNIVSSDDINVTDLTFTNNTTRIDFNLSLNMAVDGATTSVRQTAATVMLHAGSF